MTGPERPRLRRENHRFRRGTYILPACFTIANLFCGFFSLVEVSRGRFDRAAILIVAAAILDGLDGRIARLTNTTSEFGLEFDSMADIVSFGVAPAFLAYRWALLPLGRLGWLTAFLFVICAATRLARFNIQHGSVDRRWFIGLPSPPAAVSIASIAFAFPEIPTERWISGGLALTMAAVALLMVSRVRYRSFKDLDLRNRRSYTVVLPLAAGLVAVMTHPKGALLVMSATYLVSGLAALAVSLVERRGLRAAVRRSDPDEVPQDGPESP